MPGPFGKNFLLRPSPCGEFPARRATGARLKLISFHSSTMSYAVFKTGGKQYRVQEGDKLEVEKLDAEVDQEIQFGEVLLLNDGSTTTVGTPVVEGASVTARVVDQFRAPKEIAFKFKRRKGHHKTKGYRRALTKLEITGIAG